MRLRPAIILCLLALLSIGGCAGSLPNTQPDQNPNVWTSEEGPGDWNDVQAALVVGLGEAYLTSESSQSPEPGVVEVHAVDLLDRRFVIRVERGEGLTGGSVRITVRARGAPFRVPKTEQRVVEETLRRLGELAGVDVAPIGR